MQLVNKATTWNKIAQSNRLIAEIQAKLKLLKATNNKAKFNYYVSLGNVIFKYKGITPSITAIELWDRL